MAAWSPSKTPESLCACPHIRTQLIRHAAEVEGTSITEFTVAATMNHAIDVLADRRMFAIDDAAWSEFIAVLDRPVRHKPRLEKLFSEPSVFTEE